MRHKRASASSAPSNRTQHLRHLLHILPRAHRHPPLSDFPALHVLCIKKSGLYSTVLVSFPSLLFAIVHNCYYYYLGFHLSFPVFLVLQRLFDWLAARHSAAPLLCRLPRLVREPEGSTGILMDMDTPPPPAGWRRTRQDPKEWEREIRAAADVGMRRRRDAHARRLVLLLEAWSKNPIVLYLDLYCSLVASEPSARLTFEHLAFWHKTLNKAT